MNKKWKRSRCEICRTTSSCDKHHIISRADKGSNQSYNVATLCCNCHREVTSGEIEIVKRYLTSDGFMLETVRDNQRYIGNKAFNHQPEVQQLTLF
ncbi:hypothetical protein LCGC14_1140140 [marine sediment metagenome]|uniref:HNH domain-containing protein n=1 Tax=marine sediment metagenome TaxID=412755 RepID=A0A0F9M3A5_9ZZZZ